MELKDFFYFNRSDRNIIIFAAVLLFAAIAILFYLGGDASSLQADNASASESSRQHGATAGNCYSYGYDRGGRGYGRNGEGYNHDGGAYYCQDGIRQAERFPFDPNTADSTQLLRLGLHPWQVRNIYRYRAKGGIYRKPSDFANLYGLTQKEYRELEPYIRISADYLPAADRYGSKRTAANASAVPDSLKPHYPQKLQLAETIDLNTADTALLQRVPGIGPFYARKIASYRQRLGGFYSAKQLLEIEDFPEKAIVFFKVSGSTVKVAVNRLSLNQLKRHPYISYYQAKAIVDYRRLRGPLKSLDDLRLLSDFKAQDMERLSHYVAF